MADVVVLQDLPGVSLEGCVGPTAGFSYPNEVHRFYRAFWRRNVPVDIIESTTPLDKLKQYDLVVAPALITVLPGVAETLESYVSEGGSFITGYMAGIHDEHDLVVPGEAAGHLVHADGQRVLDLLRAVVDPRLRHQVLVFGGQVDRVDHPALLVEQAAGAGEEDDLVRLQHLDQFVGGEVGVDVEDLPAAAAGAAACPP